MIPRMKTRLALLIIFSTTFLAPGFLIPLRAQQTTTSATTPAAVQPSLQWMQIPNPQMEVDGLPWFAENGGALSRLPVAQKASYREAVWNLAQSPSGGRIRFRTNSSTLAIRLEYPEAPDMANMHAFGQTGVDLYISGVYRDTAVDGKTGGAAEHTYFKNQPKVMREVTLYLPLYMSVKVLGIGVDADAVVERPDGFALPKPIVFYGTSITQGGCASRSGMSYEAILGRRLNVDFVNLGFSGNGLGEPELARTVASIDAAMYVLDLAQNNPTVESLRQNYLPFIETIRKSHPTTPILVVTAIYAAHEGTAPDPILAGKREVIRQAMAQRIAAGDKHIQLIEGTELIGPARVDGLVDGTHPNDLGFEWMADGLVAKIAPVLHLKMQ
jgi:lysophospholipase L1-like esterase